MKHWSFVGLPVGELEMVVGVALASVNDDVTLLIVRVLSVMGKTPC
jgi:hypothetical protein